MTGNTARMKTDTKLRKMDKAFFHTQCGLQARTHTHILHI